MQAFLDAELLAVDTLVKMDLRYLFQKARPSPLPGTLLCHILATICSLPPISFALQRSSKRARGEACRTWMP
jgi:hypothetical protein